MRTLLKIAVNGIALWVAAVLISGITLAEGAGTTSSKILTTLLVGAVFGLVNAIVRPLAKLLGFPFLVLTLGLFIFVINAAMLILTSWLAGKLGLDFHVDRFWPTALLGSLVVSFVAWALNALLDTDDDEWHRPRGPRRPSSRGGFGDRFARRDPRGYGGPTHGPGGPDGPKLAKF